MLFTLRPLILESSGLVPAINQFAEKMKEAHGQDVFVQAEEDVVDGLSIKKQGLIFSIVEEAVNNARKHAQSQQIWIHMMREADLFTVIVEDNGVGFDLEFIDARYANGDSLGLINLRERAELVNGYLEINTFPGKGTRISLTVPITEQATEELQKPGFATQDIPFEEANLPN